MKKVDLHTHSVSSPDGGITAADYEQLLEAGVLDCIAITDHNRIAFAQKLQKKLGADKIIVGEEITSVEGEIIGLFLTKLVQPHMRVEDTIDAIKSQGGIVYIPHPLETVRKGLKAKTLERIVEDIDLLESANGRALFQNKGPQAHKWARLHNVTTFASSDAHRAKALGKTYTLLSDMPTAKTLVTLSLKGRKRFNRPSLGDVAAPKKNKLLHKLGKKADA